MPRSYLVGWGDGFCLSLFCRHLILWKNSKLESCLIRQTTRWNHPYELDFLEQPECKLDGCPMTDKRYELQLAIRLMRRNEPGLWMKLFRELDCFWRQPAQTRRRFDYSPSYNIIKHSKISSTASFPVRLGSSSVSNIQHLVIIIHWNRVTASVPAFKPFLHCVGYR